MTPARILVVEDDRIVAMDIESQLTRIGHTVVALTARGEDVMQLAIDTRPDLVLMDIRLDGSVDGIDAAQAIRERLAIPVVFLTAYADDRTVERASLVQPYGYLLKPFEDLQLRTVIEMALYKHAAERLLRASERRFVTTLSSIAEAVIATDENACVTFMNPVAESLTGWSMADGVGRPLAEVFRIVNEHTRMTVEDPAVKVLRLGTVVGLANHTVLLARDGREFPIDDSGSPIVDDRGAVTGAVLVFRDISERRQIEAAMRQAQADLLQAAQSASVSELAASIADEINQPLAAIVTNADACVLWLSGEPADVEQARGAAARVVRDAHQAGEVIRSVRGLIRKAAPKLAVVDLNELVRDILDLVRGDLQRHKVALETYQAADVLSVVGDRIQLQQVVVNLLMNGIESMSRVSRRKRTLRVSTTTDGSQAAIVVEDTGAVLEASTPSRILDPLVAQKLGGGMRLSICRTIVEAHGGKLSVTPRRPHGSILRVGLPLASLAARS